MTSPTSKPLDPECVRLVDALNGFPTIHTFCSCSGHGEDPIYVMFRHGHAYDLYAVSWACWMLEPPEGSPPEKRWHVEVGTRGVGIPLFFHKVVGPVGDFAGADRLAENLDRIRKTGVGKFMIECQKRWGSQIGFTAEDASIWAECYVEHTAKSPEELRELRRSLGLEVK